MPETIIILLATLATVARVWVLIGLSILTAWGLAYLAIRSRPFENVYVPVVNALESIPVIAFLPIVLVVFISGLGGVWGTEVAADFLVFDAVCWNIWIGAYQSFKTVPENLGEVAENYSLGGWRTFWRLLVPHSIPRITSNLFSSFADALFYITVSEVFTVGVNTYSTFGIGTLIVRFSQAGETANVVVSLLAVGIAVVAVTLLLSSLSHRAVAKYGLDTRGDITTRPGPTTPRSRWVRAFGGPGKRLSRYLSRGSGSRYASENFDGPSRHFAGWAWVARGLLLGLAGLILYGATRVVMSQSAAEWHSLLAATPYLLLAMGADYLRVGLVTLAAFGVAITAGYYLATHKRANKVLAPVLQTVAAYPVPTYFPLIFAATVGFLSAWIPWGYAEIYIFLIAFLSCFYYVFFDFWVGVLSIPSEVWEVMENHELGFFTRMRRVILPSTFPYIITGLSSTINSCWAGLAIGEFWPAISGKQSLIAGIGMMKFISSNMAAGDVAAAAWVSLLFALVVVVYGLLFTRNLMDVARKRYVVEEGVYAG